MKKKYSFLFQIVLIIKLLTFSLYAFDLEVDVLSKEANPYPVLLSKFYVKDKVDHPTDYNNILEKDIYNHLNNSNAILPRVSKESLVDDDVDLKTINLAKEISAYSEYSVIAVGKMIYKEDDDSYLIEVIIYDNNGIKKVGLGYNVKSYNLANQIPLIAADIANAIYETATGSTGFFLTSMLYSTGDKIFLSDYNGENKKVLVKSSGDLFSPNFSNNAKMVAYIESVKGHSSVFLYDLYFNKKIKLANFDALALKPRFSNDDNKLLFSLAKNGGTNIYEINLKSQEMKAITKGVGINLAGGYSFDNKYIVFTSDRSGSNQVYIMNSNSKIIRRVSRGVGSYFNVSFSPKENLILFTKIHNNKFSIGILDLKGREKLIAEDRFVESPSWFADGRHIIYQFAYKKNKSKLFYSLQVMDIIINDKKELKLSNNTQYPYLSKVNLWNNKIIGKYNF